MQKTAFAQCFVLGLCKLQMNLARLQFLLRRPLLTNGSMYEMEEEGPKLRKGDGSSTRRTGLERREMSEWSELNQTDWETPSAVRHRLAGSTLTIPLFHFGFCPGHPYQRRTASPRFYLKAVLSSSELMFQTYYQANI